MINIGSPFPAFSLPAVAGGTLRPDFSVVTNTTHAGKWQVFVFYPKDFTFVCPTELTGFAAHHSEFTDRDAVVLGCSIDSEFVHQAWRTHHPGLANLSYDLLSDFKRELSAALGILDAVSGASHRATFIVDPTGVIRFMYVTDMSVGRSPQEVLRVLDALQTDELCPCDWKPGDAVLKPGA